MDGGGAALQQLVFFGLLFAGLYFLVIRPQRARARALAEVRAGLAVGARVVMAGGIHGTVAQIDDQTVLVEVAPGVPVQFAKAAVVRILEPADSPGSDGPSA